MHGFNGVKDEIDYTYLPVEMRKRWEEGGKGEGGERQIGCSYSGILTEIQVD